MTDPVPNPMLECGRDPVAVVDRGRAGRSDAHELSCPFCQAAIAAAGTSLAAARELAADTVTVPAGLVPSVMRTVWAELRRPTSIPLPTQTGSAFVTDLAVNSLLEAVLNTLPDLLVHACSVAYAGDGGGELTVTISAAGAYLSDLTALAEQARGLVADTLRRQIGAAVRSIDIAIVDIFNARAETS